MSDKPAPGDSERLPWLEPYREPAQKLAAARSRPSKPAAARRSHTGLASLAVLGLIIAAAGGGYWLGQRGDEPAPRPVVETPALPPAAPPPQPEPSITNTVEAKAEPEPVVVPAPVVTREKPRVTERARPKPQRRANVRRADTRRTEYNRVIAKQREAARTWPKMPSPGPAGQVIQLGAFSTRARANAAYRERIARYPVLSGMPQVVVPIITQPRGEVLYVLRLGTRSREQSNVVCGNLRRSGDHCLVIG